MNTMLSSLLVTASRTAVALGLLLGTSLAAQALPADLYPPAEQRIESPGNLAYRAILFTPPATTSLAKRISSTPPVVVGGVIRIGRLAYYIDPVSGDDTHSGLKKELAWRAFNPVNRLNLAAGDQLNIIAPGAFEQTLTITGHGSAAAPIRVHFAPGRYGVFPKNALRRKLDISNTDDDPDGDKAIGLLFDHASHVEVSVQGARLVCRGKMVEVCVDRSQYLPLRASKAVGRTRGVSLEQKDTA